MTIVIGPEAAGPLVALVAVFVLLLLLVLGVFLELRRLSRAIGVFTVFLEEGEPVEIAFRRPAKAPSAKPTASTPTPKPGKPTLPN